MFVRDLMNSSVISVHADTTIREIYAVMVRYGLEDFPVVDSNQELLGMLYEENILHALYPDLRKGTSGSQDFADLDEAGIRTEGLCVRDIMTRDVRTVASDAQALWAGALMLARGVRSLPVLDQNRLAGMISQQQIFLEVMKNYLRSDAPARPVSFRKKKEVSAAADRRLFARISLSIKVAYKLTSPAGLPVRYPGRIAEALNLSPGGMLFSASEPLPPGRLVDVVFEIPGGQQPIRRLARIMRLVPGKKGIFQTGIMFLATTPGGTAEIQKYLMKIVKG